MALKIQGAAELFDLGNDEPHIHQSRPLGDTLELLIQLAQESLCQFDEQKVESRYVLVV